MNGRVIRPHKHQRGPLDALHAASLATLEPPPSPGTPQDPRRGVQPLILPGRSEPRPWSVPEAARRVRPRWCPGRELSEGRTRHGAWNGLLGRSRKSRPCSAPPPPKEQRGTRRANNGARPTAEPKTLRTGRKTCLHAVGGSRTHGCGARPALWSPSTGRTRDVTLRRARPPNPAPRRVLALGLGPVPHAGRVGLQSSFAFLRLVPSRVHAARQFPKTLAPGV